MKVKWGKYMIRYEGFCNFVKGKELVNKKISVEYLMPWNCLNLAKVGIKIWKLKLELIHVNPILFWNKMSLKSSCGTSKKTKSVEMILRDVDLFQMFLG